MHRDKILNKIRESGLVFVTIADLKKIADIEKDNSAYKTAERMIEHGLLKRLKKDLYVPVFYTPKDFEIANHLYLPSYISLETALSFYGIIPEFTYSIISVTIRKSNKVILSGKEFDYVHISSKYFYDYVRSDGFWIATPEKALIDSFYMMAKGIHRLDLDRLDTSRIKRKVFYRIASSISYIPFTNLIKKVKL